MTKKACDYYRELHRHPELSEQEYKTTEYLVSALADLGYQPVRVGSLGVYADLVTSSSLPWLLFRSDIDALPITEAGDISFPSEKPGVMHACGHDAHMSMLLEAAGRLKDKHLPQNIRFLFQPAEETTTGAAMMLAAQVMPPRCSAAFAMHVWPGVPKGTCATKVGPMMASSDVFQITCHGKSAHCARRETGADALMTAVDIVSAMPEIESLAEHDGTVLFCGSIHSGSSHNVVPDESVIRGTLRTFSEEKRARILDALKKTAAACAEKHGTRAASAWEGGCPAVNNDRRLVEMLPRVLEHIDTHACPVLAAEDFALYQRQCPGVMIWLGLGPWHLLHTDSFYVPDEILPLGVENWCRLAEENWS